MLLISLLFVVVISGWGLGRSRRDVDLAFTVFAVFGAVTAHSTMQWAFLLEGRLDQVVGDPRRGALPVVVILIAAGEAVGLWLPVLLIPWARTIARVWGSLYALAAASAAAAYHYFPFDLRIVGQEFLSEDGPPYLLAAFVCLPLAAIGYLFGRTQLANQELEAEDIPEL